MTNRRRNVVSNKLSRSKSKTQEKCIRTTQSPQMVSWSASEKTSGCSLNDSRRAMTVDIMRVSTIGENAFSEDGIRRAIRFQLVGLKSGSG